LGHAVIWKPIALRVSDAVTGDLLKRPRRWRPALAKHAAHVPRCHAVRGSATAFGVALIVISASSS
jgi:hypothetical protein